MTDLGNMIERVGVLLLLAWVPLIAILNLVLVSEVKPGEGSWRAYVGFFKRTQLKPLGMRLLPLFRFMVWAWFVGIGVTLLASAISGR